MKKIFRVKRLGGRPGCEVAGDSYAILTMTFNEDGTPKGEEIINILTGSKGVGMEADRLAFALNFAWDKRHAVEVFDNVTSEINVEALANEHECQITEAINLCNARAQGTGDNVFEGLANALAEIKTRLEK